MLQILLYYIDTRTVVAVRCRRIGRVASNSFDMAVKLFFLMVDAVFYIRKNIKL